MRHASQSSIKYLAYSLLVCLLIAMRAFSQEASVSTTSQTDTIFNEIMLNDDGVTAIDTLGEDWYYDFDRDLFIKGLPAGEGTSRGVDYPDDNDLISDPVEIRCVDELKVVPYKKTTITVGVDEYVAGDIRTNGRVTVRGWVQGDIRSRGRRVVVKDGGQVDGNIYAPRVVVEDGGIVSGEIVETEYAYDLEELAPFSVNGLIIVLSFTALLMFATFLTTALMPRQLKNLEECLFGHPWRSFFLGLFLLVTIGFIMAIIAITIVGLVVVLFVPLLYIFAMLIGAIVTGRRLGGMVLTGWSESTGGRMVQAAVGVSPFMLLWLIMSILNGSPNAVANGIGIALLVIAIIVSSFPVCGGLGAAFMTRMGFREYRSWAEKQAKPQKSSVPTPAPPPIPNANNLVPPSVISEKPGRFSPSPPPGPRPGHEPYRDEPGPPPPVPPSSETNDENQP